MQEIHSMCEAEQQPHRDQAAAVPRFDAKESLARRGEEIGCAISAIAMLLKAADMQRLEELAENQYPLETVGYLVDMMATQVFNATDDLRMASFQGCIG